MRTILLFSALILTGCSGGGGGDAADEILTKAVFENYASGVIVPTYEELAAKASALREAITTLEASPTDANLQAARDAWAAARSPWEQSEAFLFGPVDTSGYDPAIDSWPLNKTDLDAVLDSGKTIDAKFVKTLTDNQKGFHTVEYLIYGETSQKAAASITAREFEYLGAIADDLKKIALDLAASWTTGIDGKPAYKDTFATAGDPGNTAYPSLSAAGQEIVQGMINICGEVSDGKIAEPFDQQNPNLVESQFSFNSLKDFADNMRSIENGYNGHRAGTTAPAGSSLTEKIAAKDSALDERIKSEIADTIAKIEAIPEPFPVSLKDSANAETIKAAQASIRKLNETLTNDLLPLLK